MKWSSVQDVDGIDLNEWTRNQKPDQILQSSLDSMMQGGSPLLIRLIKCSPGVKKFLDLCRAQVHYHGTVKRGLSRGVWFIDPSWGN